MPDVADTLTPEEERAHTIKGLRHLAFLLEAHPELPAPESFWNFGTPRFEIKLRGYKTAEEEETVKAKLQAIVKALRKSYFKGKIAKDYTDSQFKLTVPLSPTTELVVIADREEVCTKRVLGTRVEQQPVYETVRTGTKPVVVEDVEWDCDPILAGAAA